jgi:hypothetical protein
MVSPSPREPSDLACVTTGSGVAFLWAVDEWGALLGELCSPFVRLPDLHSNFFSSNAWSYICVRSEGGGLTIKKVAGGYKVVSSKGKNLGGPYKTKKEAEERLRQVEFFKHKKG